MTDATVLIIGASVRAAAQSAVRAGWNVVASDMFGDADLRAVAEFVPIENYPEDFAHIIAARPELPVLYTGGLENYPKLLDLPATLWGNRGRSVRASRDVFHWSSTLQSAGFEIAELTEWNQPPRIGTDWLVKSNRSAGGGGVMRADSATHPNPDSYYQRRIDGPTIAAVFVAEADRTELFGVTRQLTGLAAMEAGPFAYCGSVGPVNVDSKTWRTMSDIGGLLSREFVLRGVFGIDFVLSGNGVPIPVEVNPRYTASVEVLELVTGLSLLHPSVVSIEAGPEFGIKLIVYASSDVTINTLPHGSDEAWLADIPNPGTRINRGEPVCTVLAMGPDGDAAIAGAGEIVSSLGQVVPIAVDGIMGDLVTHCA